MPRPPFIAVPSFGAEIVMAACAGAPDSGTTVKRVYAKVCKLWQVGNGTRAMEVHLGLKLAEVSSHCHDIADYTSRFWVEKGAWKHHEKYVDFFCAIDFVAQVHKV